MFRAALTLVQAAAPTRVLRVAWLAGGLFVCAPAVLAQAPADTPSVRILALESQGRAHPIETANELERLLPLTPEHSAERLELLTVQGLIHAVGPQPAAAEQSALRLEAWGQDAKAPNAAAAGALAQLIRARTIARDGNLQRADAMMQDALAHLPDTPPRSRYRFIAANARVKGDLGKLEAAVRLGHEALALADRTDEPWRQAEARSALAYSYSDAHQFERARTLAEEGLALADKVHDWIALSRGNNTLGIVLDGLGDAQGQRRSFELALDYARRAGSKSDEVLMLANMADFFLKTGDYETALKYAERALPLARELNPADGGPRQAADRIRAGGSARRQPTDRRPRRLGGGAGRSFAARFDAERALMQRRIARMLH